MKKDGYLLISGIISERAPEIIEIIDREGYKIVEMKTEKGKQQPSQKIWQRAVEDAGYKYIICRSFEDFMEQINGYLR